MRLKLLDQSKGDRSFSLESVDKVNHISCAMLFHAFTDAGATHEWLQTWAERLGNSKLAELRSDWSLTHDAEVGLEPEIS